MPLPTASSSPPSSCAVLRRRSLLAAGALIALAGCAMPPEAAAVGHGLVDIEIVDRETGQVLDVHRHAGRWYVAGRPGARYAIRITNKTGARILAVTAVDGVNVLSGQTAAWGQSGYVFEPWQRYEVTGWRKSDSQVAAFEFTSLPDSYAARTGRPLDIGVIGVAAFRERVVRPAWRDAERERRSSGAFDGRLERQLAESAPRSEAPAESARGADSGSASGSAAASRAAPPTAPAPQSAAAPAAEQAKAAARADRLGTGHGQREDSWVTTTQFDRASSTPDEIVSVQYDRYENLLAAGIIGSTPIVARPRPFPSSRDIAGYVPDPPSRY